MNILDAFKNERTRIQARLHVVNTAINALSQSPASHASNSGAKRTRRRMSAKARAAIGKAARERWARFRAGKKEMKKSDLLKAIQDEIGMNSLSTFWDDGVTRAKKTPKSRQVNLYRAAVEGTSFPMAMRCSIRTMNAG